MASVGNPIRLSETPITYRKTPPNLGEDTSEVLQTMLGKSAAQIDLLVDKGVV